MERILELDEILDITPEVSEIKFTNLNKNKFPVPDGIVRLFSLVMARLVPHSRLPLNMRYNWADEDSDYPGTFWIYIYEVITTRGLFWTRHRHIDIVDSHYDSGRRKLNISFQCPGDYDDTIDPIKTFVAEHPELEIKTLSIFIWEKTPDGQRATKLVKVNFL